MRETYTIGRLAKAADVPVSTLRYYERTGLVVPDARSDSNYRVYGRDALERLHFIRRAKDAGLTLDDIAALLDIQDGSSQPCDAVRELIEHRLAELDERMRDLEQLRGTLSELRETCRRAAEKDHCLVLDRLAD